VARNGDDVRQAAMKELARRELARRQSRFVGPVPTGEELAAANAPPAAPKMGLLEAARLTASPQNRIGLGAAEAAASIGTGMVASPINHLWNAMMEAGELPTGQPVGTYQPRTPEGQGMLKSVDAAMRFTRIPQLLEKGMDLQNPDPGVRATGNLIGAALGAMPAVGPMRAAKARRAAIPTRAEIKTAAGEAYTRAEQAGGILPQNNLGGFVQRTEQMLAKEGFDKTLNPATAAALERFYDDASRPGVAGHSAMGAEILRRVLLNAENAAKAGSQDARLVSKIIDDFDDFMDQQLPSSSGQYADARLLWSTQRKAQDIEALFERAKNQAGQFSVSGMENALRTQFKQLADNPRRLSRFSEPERAAILQVVRGGPLQYVLRLAGKLAPTGNVPIITALLAEGAAPGAGLTMAGVGVAGRAGASALRNRAARRVDELVRSGAIPAMPASRAGTPGLPRLGYLPGAALAIEQPANALYREQDRRNALTRPAEPAPASGPIEAGNIDLNNRPVVRNDDGSISTVRSASFNIDGQEVLLPTVTDDGRVIDETTEEGAQEIIDTYLRTGRHLGKFRTPEDATRYAQTLHEQQSRQYGGEQRNALKRR
jgi:hypothetical protein